MMVDCPHLQDAVKTTCLDSIHEPPWSCIDCGNTDYPWMCLYCGVVRCGRYANAHAMAHYKSECAHNVLFDCNGYSVYCYACDDYVTNDHSSRTIGLLRKKILQLNDDNGRAGGRPQLSSTVANTGNSGDASSVNDGISEPRSSVTTVCELAGLRNLGNTCFMNAVLQALSAVVPFRAYLLALPAFDNSTTAFAWLCRLPYGREVALQRSAATLVQPDSTTRLPDVVADAVLSSSTKAEQTSDRNASTAVGQLDTSANGSGRQFVLLAPPTADASASGTRMTRNATKIMRAHQTLLQGFRDLDGVSSSSTTPCAGGLHLNTSSETDSQKPAESNDNESIGTLDNALLAEELRRVFAALARSEPKRKVAKRSTPSSASIPSNAGASSSAGNGESVSPENLLEVVWKAVPRFRGYQQQDAHEFLRYLLDHLHSELCLALYFHHYTRCCSVMQSASSPTAVSGNTSAPSLSRSNSRLDRTGSGGDVGPGRSPRQQQSAFSGELLRVGAGGSIAVPASLITNASTMSGEAIERGMQHACRRCCWPGERASVVTGAFGGVLHSEVACLQCGMVSVTPEPFLDLQLDIPARFSKTPLSTRTRTRNTPSANYSTGTPSSQLSALAVGSGAAQSAAAPIDEEASLSSVETRSAESLQIPANAGSSLSASMQQKSTPRVCTLYDCIESFTAVEPLSETEFYRCPSCERRQPSTKRFWIKRLPPVLCLQLKRFVWQNQMARVSALLDRVKLDTFVEFPLRNLDMRRFVVPCCASDVHEQPTATNSSAQRDRERPTSNAHQRANTTSTCATDFEYDLAAAIVHHGSGAGSGHYTTYARHGATWYHFNDTQVTPVTEDTVRKSHAYILIYVQRDCRVLPCSVAERRTSAASKSPSPHRASNSIAKGDTSKKPASATVKSNAKKSKVGASLLKRSNSLSDVATKSARLEEDTTKKRLKREQNNSSIQSGPSALTKATPRSNGAQSRRQSSGRRAGSSAVDSTPLPSSKARKPTATSNADPKFSDAKPKTVAIQSRASAQRRKQSLSDNNKVPAASHFKNGKIVASSNRKPSLKSKTKSSPRLTAEQSVSKGRSSRK